MLHQRLKAAKMVADDLNALENAIDETLIRASKLMASTAGARRDMRLAASVAQDAIAKTGSSIAALYEARAQIVAAHQNFAAVRDELGLTPRMTGDLWKFAQKSDDQQEEPQRIRIVG